MHESSAQITRVPTAPVDLESFRAASELLRCLTAPVRLALISQLSKGALCVHELVDELDIAQPLVSQHLRVLRQAGLVEKHKRGREAVYSLVDDHVAHIVRDALTHAEEVN